MLYKSSRRWERRRRRGNWPSRLLSALWTPIGSNGLFFFFVYLLGLVCILVDGRMETGMALLALFFDDYLICALLCVFPGKARRWVKYALSICLYGIAILDMWYGCLPASGLVENQDVGLLTAVWLAVKGGAFTLKSLLSPALIVVAMAVVHAFFTFKRLLLPRLNIADWLLGLLTLAVLIWSAVASWPQKKGFVADDAQAAYLPVYRLGNAERTITLKTQGGSLAEEKSAVQALQVDSCSQLSPNIVVVTGNSYSRSHSQLYGYDKATTPWQLAASKDGSLIPFSNAVSLVNERQAALRKLFYYNGNGTEDAATNVLGLLKDGGYELKLVSNYTNEKALPDSLFLGRNLRTYRYDLALVRAFDSLKATASTAPQVYVVQLRGQQQPYRDRYPRKAAKYLASDYADNNIPEGQKAELAEYDNATAYNDYVLSQLASVCAKEDVVMIYVPTGLKEQKEIPFWIWTSKEYRRQRPEVWHKMWNARNKSFRTDRLPQLLMSLAGLKVKVKN